MINLSEHHENLLLGKITGTLTHDEVIELNDLLSSDDSIHRAYKDLLERFPADLAQNNFQRLDEPGYWRNLTADLQRKHLVSKRIGLFRKIAVAATIVGLTLGAWYFFTISNNKISPPVTKKPESIQLKLASGKVIDLTNQKGPLKADGAAINNENKSLHYTTSDSAGAGINSVTVPVGMDYKITLSDGSEVWMNSVTRLDFPLSLPLIHAKSQSVEKHIVK